MGWRFARRTVEGVRCLDVIPPHGRTEVTVQCEGDEVGTVERWICATTIPNYSAEDEAEAFHAGLRERGERFVREYEALLRERVPAGEVGRCQRDGLGLLLFAERGMCAMALALTTAEDNAEADGGESLPAVRVFG